MKTMKTKIIFCLVAILSLVSVKTTLAQNFKENVFIYTIIDDSSVEIIIDGSSEINSSNIVIPETVNYDAKTYSVTSIGKEAFKYYSIINNIDMPKSITRIGNEAFALCGLTSVTIPDGVTYIGEGAFSGCSKLTSASIPSSVTCIGNGAFSACGSLTMVNVDGNNKHYTSIEGILFSKNNDTLVCFPAGKSKTSYTISNVMSIQERAFEGCKKLTSVTIPSSVTSIGNSAFLDCTGLESITIGNGVNSIGNSAFAWCTSLNSVTIPNSITNIGDGAFACSGLLSVTIPGSVVSLGDGAFDSCSRLISATIEKGVNNIGNNTFSSCIDLTTVSIPSTVTSIGNGAFAGNYYLSKVIFHNPTPPVINKNVFSYLKKSVLYVPASAVETYKDAEVWKNFNQILPLEDPSNINSTYFNLIVSPNPVKDIVYFSEKVNKVSVYSLQGNLVYQTVINNNEMNISHLHNGMYMLRIYVTEKDVVDIKLIKQ